MDVILLQDVARIGKEGAVIHVKSGFARNYLFPRRLAAPASEQTLKAVEERTRQTARKAARVQDDAESLRRKLENRSLTLKLTVGEGDQAFGSVTTHEIAHALQQDGMAVEKAMLQLEEPIKTLGIYEVPVRLHPSVTATLKVWVVKA